MNTYENGTITYNGLNWSWQRLGLDDDGKTERFNVTISNGKKQMAVIFHNSQLEKQISDFKKSGYSLTEIKRSILKLMWGGYDDTKTIREFNQKRIYWLISSIVYSVASDFCFNDNSFYDFCDNCGYDRDSRKAEAIYFQLQEQNDALNKMLTSEQRNYFINVTQREEDADSLKELCGVK